MRLKAISHFFEHQGSGRRQMGQGAGLGRHRCRAQRKSWTGGELQEGLNPGQPWDCLSALLVKACRQCCRYFYCRVWTRR